ncbi:MAG: hypothetical protein OHK0031_19410 [Anaerolineales bacterium]
MRNSLRLLLVIALLMGFTAFSAHSAAQAQGTVPNPGGKDSGSCANDRLFVGTAIAYVNGVQVQGCASNFYLVFDAPSAPGLLRELTTPVALTFSDKTYIPRTTICFATRPNTAGQIFFVAGDPQNGTPLHWIPMPSYEVDTMTCTDTWGGGTFGYFGG